MGTGLMALLGKPKRAINPVPTGSPCPQLLLETPPNSPTIFVVFSFITISILLLFVNLFVLENEPPTMMQMIPAKRSTTTGHHNRTLLLVALPHLKHIKKSEANPQRFTSDFEYFKNIFIILHQS